MMGHNLVNMMGIGFGDLRFLQPYWMLLPLLLFVDILLKGIALWHAARDKQKYWFIALLIINSAGILPLVYLFLNKNKNSKTAAKK